MTKFYNAKLEWFVDEIEADSLEEAIEKEDLDKMIGIFQKHIDRLEKELHDEEAKVKGK
jgi:hypothetical protein